MRRGAAVVTQGVALSICIPTYNRAAHLANCLHSIARNGIDDFADVQICVSDNASTDDTETIITAASRLVPIKRHRQTANVGFARNLLSVVGMADGEFVWVIGDDDLLVPEAIHEVRALLTAHPDVDYFFVNASHLAAEYVLSCPQPFDLAKLPDNLPAFSARTVSGPLPFLDLIDPGVSFDFLGAIFLSVYRRDKWLAHADVLDPSAIADPRVFANFDNTFPQIKVYARAFSRSRAFFHATPLTVCLLGAREWSKRAALLNSVRLVEAVDEYRHNGLSLIRYLLCRNSALRSFGPDFVRMLLDKEASGYRFIASPARLLAINMWFPNFYLSFVYPFFRRSFWQRFTPVTLAPSRG